jgi:hypothetical protein
VGQSEKQGSDQGLESKNDRTAEIIRAWKECQPDPEIMADLRKLFGLTPELAPQQPVPAE